MKSATLTAEERKTLEKTTRNDLASVVNFAQKFVKKHSDFETDLHLKTAIMIEFLNYTSYYWRIYDIQVRAADFKNDQPIIKQDENVIVDKLALNEKLLSVEIGFLLCEISGLIHINKRYNGFEGTTVVCPNNLVTLILDNFIEQYMKD